MLPAGLKPAIPVSEQMQTLDHAGTGIREYTAVAYVVMLCVNLPLLLIVGHIVGTGGFSIGYADGHTK
jgi:hypothetical protein